MSLIVKEAREIALKNLRDCYSSGGILAGTHHFTDYWARDAFFAAFGSMEVGDEKKIRELTKYFFSYQRPDGLIPYRIMRGPVSIKKYFGHPSFYSFPKPTYKLRGIGQEIYDGTTLSVIFASITRQSKLLPQIEKSLSYLSSKEKGGLLWDGPMAEWNDIVWKKGHLLYTNVLYWKMYQELSLWFIKVDKKMSKKFSDKRDSIGNAMKEILWNGKYFADWSDSHRQDYFYPFGNCLAVTWGLTDSKQSSLILDHCKKIYQGVFLTTNSPAYPWYRVDLLQRLAGMSDYQNNGLNWWQPVTAYLCALRKTGHKTEAVQISQKIAQKIVQDGAVYECYEKSGEPVKRLLYKAESPFAWSAGMILWALGAK